MPEIETTDEFGINITEAIKTHGLCINLEIGSHDGTGSTQCIINGIEFLRESGKWNVSLQCVEQNPFRYIELCKNVVHLSYVHTYNMSSIDRASFVPRNFDEIWESKFNNHKNNTQYPRDMVESWYNEDVLKFNDIGFLNNQFYIYPEYDSVLIDGGEFAGYSEFKLLKDKTRCFFLDDVHKAYKCAQIYDELLHDDQWKLIAENPDVRNGYAIFIRKYQKGVLL